MDEVYEQDLKKQGYRFDLNNKELTEFINAIYEGQITSINGLFFTDLITKQCYWVNWGYYKKKGNNISSS